MQVVTCEATWSPEQVLREQEGSPGLFFRVCAGATAPASFRLSLEGRWREGLFLARSIQGVMSPSTSAFCFPPWGCNDSLHLQALLPLAWSL